MAWATGDALTLDRLNGPTASFTPTWTSSGTPVSLGDGTLVGSYSRVGRRVMFSISLTMGSTTTFGTGNYKFALPSTPTGPLFATAVLTDISTNIRIGVGKVYTGSDIGVAYDQATGGWVAATAPFTFVSGDIIEISGEYYE